MLAFFEDEPEIGTESTTGLAADRWLEHGIVAHYLTENTLHSLVFEGTSVLMLEEMSLVGASYPAAIDMLSALGSSYGIEGEGAVFDDSGISIWSDQNAVDPKVASVIVYSRETHDCW